MPRYNATLTLHFWMDAENENALDDAAAAIELFAHRDTAANVQTDRTELTISEEPRPTNAELSSTI